MNSLSRHVTANPLLRKYLPNKEVLENLPTRKTLRRDVRNKESSRNIWIGCLCEKQYGDHFIFICF
jgi:hypothetical protein